MRLDVSIIRKVLISTLNKNVGYIMFAIYWVYDLYLTLWSTSDHAERNKVVSSRDHS